MLVIKFKNGIVTNADFKNIKENIIELIGDNVNNLSGFKTYSEKGLYLGDYSEFTTKYNIYTEIENGIMLSMGEVEPEPYIPPAPPVKTECEVTFVGNEYCELVGKTYYKVKVGSDLSKIKAPTVNVTDEKYEFKGWSQELIGEATADLTIYAIVEIKEEYTTEGRLGKLESGQARQKSILENIVGEVPLYE